MVKNPPAMQEMRVRSLGWEDPLVKEMATHSSILARKILSTEKPGGLQSMGSLSNRAQIANRAMTFQFIEDGSLENVT